MKILSALVGQTKIPVSVVVSLLCLSVQHKLFAPPATPTPTYYADGLGDPFGTGSFLAFAPVPGDPGEYELNDWDLITPDGDITPSDSTLSGATIGTGPGYFLSDTQIPLDDLNFSGTGSEAGSSWNVNLGGEVPDAGTIGESGANPGISDGTWAAPDSSNTLALTVFAFIALGVIVPRRSARSRS